MTIREDKIVIEGITKREEYLIEFYKLCEDLDVNKLWSNIRDLWLRLSTSDLSEVRCSYTISDHKLVRAMELYFTIKGFNVIIDMPQYPIIRITLMRTSEKDLEGNKHKLMTEKGE